MLKDITLGRYYSISSVLHSLDPRTKIVFLTFYLVSVFFANSLATCIFTATVLAVLIVLSKVPLKFMFRGLRTIAVIVLVADLINILTVEQGLVKSAIITLRMVEIVLASNLLTLTTKPKDIADATEMLLSPLKKIKVPVHDFATIIAIAVRFIPILTTEAQTIAEAQKARGADFESKNLFKRVKTFSSVLIPLFALSFKKADELADAMDSRLYAAKNPTRLHLLLIGEYDILSFILTAEYVAVFILWRVLCL